ncbi:MAG: nuclear transport factor 2 family protein [Pseudomonadota bacterium]|nr:nuclear transport factor 2 family protein [Pseudomonadota bacterium]
MDLDLAELPGIVKSYISAYNRKDVDALIACVTDDVRFENVSNSGPSLATTSKAAFADLARQSAEAFYEREQSVRRTVMGDDAVAVEIDYRARLAADLPNGMKAGDVLQLRGVSLFKLRDGRIAEILDFS